MNIDYYRNLNQRGVYIVCENRGCLVFYAENMLDHLSKQLRTNKQIRSLKEAHVSVLQYVNEYENIREQYDRECEKLQKEGWIILNYKKAFNCKVIKEIIETTVGYKIRVAIKDTNYKIQEVIGIFNDDLEYKEFLSVFNKLDSPNAIRAWNSLTREFYELQ